MAQFWDSEPIIEVIGTKLFCDSGYIEIYPDGENVDFYPSVAPELNSTEDYAQWIDKTIQSLPFEYKREIDSRWAYTVYPPENSTKRIFTAEARETMSDWSKRYTPLSSSEFTVSHYKKNVVIIFGKHEDWFQLAYDEWALCKPVETVTD